MLYYLFKGTWIYLYYVVYMHFKPTLIMLTLFNLNSIVKYFVLICFNWIIISCFCYMNCMFRIRFKIYIILSFRTLKDNQLAYLADLLVRPKCAKYLQSTNLNKFFVTYI